MFDTLDNYKAKASILCGDFGGTKERLNYLKRPTLVDLYKKQIGNSTSSGTSIVADSSLANKLEIFYTNGIDKIKF